MDHYKNITESLKLLSLSFEEQVKYFPHFVDVPFEVIDTFGNAVLLLPGVIESGKLGKKAIASILRLRNVINITLSNPDFKDLDDEQFKVSDEWDKVREMAKDTLQLMGEPLGKPDLNYI